MPSIAPLRIVQITDTHLFAEENQRMRDFPTVGSFQTVMEAISRLQPQPNLLLLTGDLSQDETIASYERLRDRVTALQIPAYWLPGNHDQSLAALEQVLCTDLISPVKCFQAGGWQVILLNSMLEQQVQGEISSESLISLEQQLQAAPTQPTLIALHHPPLAIGSAWMDAIGLQNRDAFFAVIDRYPQIKLVIFGHIHQEFDRERNSVHYLGAPSTCIQFSPNCDQFVIDWDAAPGFRLLSLWSDGRYETEVRRVPFTAAIAS